MSSVALEQAEQDIQALEVLLAQKRVYRAGIERQAEAAAEQYRKHLDWADEQIEEMQEVIRKGWESVTLRRAQGDRFPLIEPQPAVSFHGIEKA